MSTRANVMIFDDRDKLYFYRHSDGYPSGALPTLIKFMRWVSERKIRDNVSQASGWLVLIGADEYGNYYDYKTGDTSRKSITEPYYKDSLMGWKCGAYEPTTGWHGDIEYAYELDLIHKMITVYDVGCHSNEKDDWKCIMKITDFSEESMQNIIKSFEQMML